MIRCVLSSAYDPSIFDADGLSFSVDDTEPTDPSEIFWEQNPISAEESIDSNVETGPSSTDWDASWLAASNLLEENIDLDMETGPSSTDWDTSWLTTSNPFDDSSIEAACPGNGPESLGKRRRRRGPMCFEDSQNDKPSDDSLLNTPNIPQLREDAFGFPVFWPPGDYFRCPKLYPIDLCCTGPAVQFDAILGLFAYVYGCSYRQFFSSNDFGLERVRLTRFFRYGLLSNSRVLLSRCTSSKRESHTWARTVQLQC
jgi:hypothetical protein